MMLKVVTSQGYVVKRFPHQSIVVLHGNMFFMVVLNGNY